MLWILFIFWIQVLYQKNVLQVFSPSLWLVFSFSKQPLTEQKFLILMACQFVCFWLCHVARRILVPWPGIEPMQWTCRVLTTELTGQPLNFFFMNCDFSVVSKTSSPKPRSPRLYPMFSSRSFIILHFTLRSVIQFELILVKDVWSLCFCFISYMDTIFSRTTCWKGYSFSIELPLYFCQRSVDYICVSISGVLFLLFCVCTLFSVLHCLDYCSFIATPESSSVGSPILFFFSIVLASLGPSLFFF